MSDTDPLSGAYCKEHDIYLCEECEKEYKEKNKKMLKDSEDLFTEKGILNQSLVINSINSLVQACHRIAKDHGFWNDEDKLKDMINHMFDSGLYDESILLDRLKIIRKLFNTQCITLEMSELAERLECLRKNPEKLDEHCPEFLNLEIEVADLIIRAFDFSGRRNLRLGEAIIVKMEYNASRPYLHNKKF